MDHKEAMSRLRLARTTYVGPITCQLLMARYGTAVKALAAIPEISARGGRKLTPFPADKAREEWDKLYASGGQFMFRGTAEYPAALEHYDDAPFILSVRGHASLLQRKGCAIIGARNASLNACKLAERLGAEIGEGGFTIISGMARGIDAAAHLGSLKTGTIAVLANGVGIPYPRENAALFSRLIEEGVVLSEMPFITQPSPKLFPIRNRIIASLAKDELIIEAAVKSGALITAQEAANRSIDVMAIPGSPLDPRSAGTNSLIKDGAALVQNAQDVLAVLTSQTEVRMPDITAYTIAETFLEQTPELSETEWQAIRENVRENLAHDPIAVDELCRWCHVSANIMQSVLFDLELSGYLQRHSGNRVSQTVETL